MFDIQHTEQYSGLPHSAVLSWLKAHAMHILDQPWAPPQVPQILSQSSNIKCWCWCVRSPTSGLAGSACFSWINTTYSSARQAVPPVGSQRRRRVNPATGVCGDEHNTRGAVIGKLHNGLQLPSASAGGRQGSRRASCCVLATRPRLRASYMPTPGRPAQRLRRTDTCNFACGGSCRLYSQRK